MEVKIHFSDEEEKHLKKAAKNIELENYCKIAAMWRAVHENVGIYPIH